MTQETTVGVVDAKTHLNSLLRRVSEGETIRITRRGIPIAKLVPADAREEEDLEQVARDIRERRKGATLGKVRIDELIGAGQRH
jgi:prevent-host-death family protein